jgi:hypothetical protein
MTKKEWTLGRHLARVFIVSPEGVVKIKTTTIPRDIINCKNCGKPTTNASYCSSACHRVIRFGKPTV